MFSSEAFGRFELSKSMTGMTTLGRFLTDDRERAGYLVDYLNFFCILNFDIFMLVLVCPEVVESEPLILGNSFIFRSRDVKAFGALRLGNQRTDWQLQVKPQIPYYAHAYSFYRAVSSEIPDCLRLTQADPAVPLEELELYLKFVGSLGRGYEAGRGIVRKCLW